MFVYYTKELSAGKRRLYEKDVTSSFRATIINQDQYKRSNQFYNSLVYLFEVHILIGRSEEYVQEEMMHVTCSVVNLPLAMRMWTLLQMGHAQKFVSIAQRRVK